MVQTDIITSDINSFNSIESSNYTYFSNNKTSDNIDITSNIFFTTIISFTENSISDTVNIKNETNNSSNNNLTLENYFKSDIIKNENNLTKDEIINKIKNLISNRNTNLNSVIGENKDLLIKDDDITYQITTLDQLKNNENNNISTLNLDNCENILKTVYEIDKNDSLIIFKVDYFKEGLLIPIIGYEIYHPLNNSLLDLKYCSNETTNISIPVTINEKEAFKYDPKSEYYTDDCNPYTTDNGTDIILIDRQNEFVINNMSLCENGCEFEKYDEEKQMAICKCEIKNKQIVISEILNDTNTLNNNFTTNYSSSFKMKCYHILFSKEGLEKNVESYILIFIIICFIILGILFQKCGYPMLNSDMKQIIEFKEENKNIHNNVNMNDTNDNKDNKKANNCTEKEKNEIMAIKQNIKKRDIKQSKVNPIQIDSKDNPNSFSKINSKIVKIFHFQKK